METKYNGKQKKKVLIKNSYIFIIVGGEAGGWRMLKSLAEFFLPKK